MKNNIKIVLFASLIVAMILPFSVMGVADARSVQTEQRVNQNLDYGLKSLVKEKMEAQYQMDISGESHTAEEYGIPYSMAFEDDGVLVVGINPQKSNEQNIQYTLEDVKLDLNTQQEVSVSYMIFERETIRSTGVFGANTIQSHFGNNDDRNSSATITLIRDGKIITTGHIEENPENLYIVCGTDNEICLAERALNPSSDGTSADSSYYTTTSEYLNLQENKIKVGSRSYSVVDGDDSDIAIGDRVRMISASGLHSGYVLDNDATVRDGLGVLTHQAIGTYKSAVGESGAPIFKFESKRTVKIIGQHVGKACLFDLNGDDIFSNFCADPENPTYTIFSTWSNVKSNLGIN